MEDDEIQRLKEIFSNCNQLYFEDTDGKLIQIYRIGKAPPPLEGEFPEPSEVAFVAHNKYIALYNVEINSFFTVERIKAQE